MQTEAWLRRGLRKERERTEKEDSPSSDEKAKAEAHRRAVGKLSG